MKRFLTIAILAGAIICAPLTPALASDDRAYTTVRLNKFGSVIIKTGQKFGFDISGLVIPFFTKDGELAGPDHQPTATWKAAFSEYLTPQNYKDDGKHIDWDAGANPIYYTSYYGAILKTDAEHSNHPEPTDCYISTTFQKTPDIPFAPLDFQKAREADGWLGISPVDPNDSGIVDFNLPSKTIGGMNPAEDCKKHDLGFERDPVEVDVTQFAQFGAGTAVYGFETTTIMTIVREFVEAIGEWVERQEYEKEPHKDDVILTEKKMFPWYHVGCHDGGCPANESGEFSGNSPESGGYTAFTLREEDKKPLEDASKQPYEISVLGFKQRPFLASYDIRNQSEVRQKQAACYSVPDTSNTSMGNLQDTAAIGGKLLIRPECSPIVLACGGEPPKFTGSSSCNQCSPNMSGWAESGTVPGNKLPQNLINMVEQVGQAFGVPPASILAAMYHEGAFVSTQLDPTLYQSGPFTGADAWTDENVIKWSTCGQTMPNCPLEDNAFANCHVGGANSEQCSKAIVGTGMIPYWFWGTGGGSDVWNAVQKIDPSRTQETINPCNLLDSVAALGKALSMWGLYPRTPATCYNRPMTSASAGTCSPSSWSDDKIVQSHVGLWVGSLPFCPDGTMPPPPGFGANSPDPGYADNKVLAPYKAFSCQ